MTLSKTIKTIKILETISIILIIPALLVGAILELPFFADAISGMPTLEMIVTVIMIIAAVIILGCMLGASILYLLFGQCPNCWSRLPWYGLTSMKYCPYCRSKLDDM